MPSHLGNKYNYYVGAYLKTHVVGYGEGKELNLQNHDFDIPINIPAESSEFQRPLSLDLVASLSDSEYFAECKYSEDPRPLRATSREFMYAILEFLGLERYRKLTFRKQVEYIFVTNNSVRILIRSLDKLKSATSRDLSGLLYALEKTAKKKWTGFNSKIQEPLLRSVLNRLIVLEIDKGALSGAEHRPDFQQALRNIQAKLRMKGITLPFSLIMEEANTITITCEECGQQFAEFTKLGFSLRIPTMIIDRIKTHLRRKYDASDIAKVDGSKLEFLKTLKVNAPENISHGFTRRIVTETINDEISCRQGYERIFLVVSPEERALLVFNKDWLMERVKAASTSRGTYEVSKVASCLPFLVSNGLLKLAIIEANRLKGIIIDYGWFEEE